MKTITKKSLTSFIIVLAMIFNIVTFGSITVYAEGESTDVNTIFEDDFENYENDTTISSGKTPYTVRYNGTGDENQKIVTSTQKDGSTGKVLQLQGASGWASEIKHSFTPDDRQYLVFEIEIKPVSGSSPGGINICSSQADGYWTHSICRVILENGGFFYGKNDKTTPINTELTYTNGNWYHIKLILDQTNHRCYIIFDNSLISNEGFEADPATPEWINLCAGNSGTNTMYYDNIQLYSTNTLNVVSVITFETNGGSSVDSQSIVSGNKVTRPATDPTRAGYTFAGWYKDSTLTEEFNFDTETITSHTTIYAKWNEIHTHTLTLVPATAATCSSTGNNAYYICSGCMKVFTDASGTVETTVAAQTTAINPTAHDWDSGSVTTPTTCTTTGVKTYTCQHNNKHTKTETIDKIKHTLVHIKEVAATCTSDGNDEYYQCSACDQYFTDALGTSVIADKSTVIRKATDHNWGKWTVTTPATEESVGEESRTCQNDSTHKETRVIPKLIHTHKLTLVPATAATCSSTGNNAYYICSGCMKVFTDASGTVETTVAAQTTAINPTAHDWDSGSVTTPTTCTTTGVKTYTCQHNNKHTKTETIDKIKHTLVHIKEVAATCTSDGNDEYYQCSACDQYFTDALGTSAIADKSTVVRKATDHNWGEWLETTPATVDDQGVKTRICANDSSHKETATIDRLPYAILEGDNQTFVIDSNQDIIVRANGTFEKFVGLQMDGKEIDSKYYTAVSGSTIVTLAQEFLDTLDEGEHTLTFVYTDGTVDSTLKKAKENTSSSPQTGDNIKIWINLFVISVFGIMSTIRFIKKRS